MKLNFYWVLITIALFLSGCSLVAQHTLKGSFTGPIAIEEVILEEFGVKPTQVISSVVTDNQFSLVIPKDLETGIYKLNYKAGQSKSGFDLIINNKEDIQFSIELSSSQFNLPVYTKSETNKNWLIQQEKFLSYNQKIAVLKQAWAQYPDKKDKIVKQIEKEIFKLIDDKTKAFKDLHTSYAFMALVMENSQPLEVFNPDIPAEKQDSLSIAHFWDNIKVNRLELLNSPVFNNLIYEYINYHLKLIQSLPLAEQNRILKQCVDTILEHFTQKETRIFAINYLTQGFKQLGNEHVLQYIDETYSNIDQCENPNALNTRLEGYKKLKPGNKAPAIMVSGKNILDSTSDQKTVLAFWASWCPHCTQEIPVLNAFAKTNNLRVVAVSLDDKADAYNEMKATLPDMIHHCDFNKWESKPVKDYYINATPTYFLLDKEGRIIKKYTSIQSIKDEI